MFHLVLGASVAGTIPPVSVENPNRQPQLASHGKVVALVFGSGKSVMFTRSEDQGRTFQKPVAIAEIPVLPLGRHRGPRVAFANGAIVVTTIGGSSVATGPHAHGLPSDGNLLSWRSTDGGRTWSKAVIVNDVPSSAREGLHALASDDKGQIAAVWLDLRAKGTRLYGSVSSDGGNSWSQNVKLFESTDGTICQCCHPSVIATGNGEFAVMFRNVLGGNRDMYLVRMRDGKVIGTSKKLGQGSWPINACPMDGGGLAVANGDVFSAWRRDKDVYMAAPGKSEMRLGPGKDVALAASGDKLIAVWSEKGIQAYLSGKVEALSNDGAFPAVLGLGDGSALVAWEEQGAISVRVLPSSTPVARK